MAGARPWHRFVPSLACALAAATIAAPPAPAFTSEEPPSRFERLVKPARGATVGVRTDDVRSLVPHDPARLGWERFGKDHGGGWQVSLDRRNGLPTLVAGRGIAWLPGETPTVPALETLVRRFLGQHRTLLGDWTGQLVLDADASGPIAGDVWQITLRQKVGGVPVEGTGFDFHVSHGRLVSFGARRLAPVTIATTPSVDRDAAHAALHGYLGLASDAEVVHRGPAGLLLRVVDPAGVDGAVWTGPRGAGYAHRLVWRFTFTVPGEHPTWVADVDAHSGEVVSLLDDNKYSRVKGVIFPITNDGDCANQGCEEKGYPMQFSDYTESGWPLAFTGDHGLYTCAAEGNPVTSTLQGKYILVTDSCGPISETSRCADDIDFYGGVGSDCNVPPGHALGDTAAARTSFFHLNHEMQKGRAYLPTVSWLTVPLQDFTNISPFCNAFWTGAVNFFSSDPFTGCRNTGEIQGVVSHEWGHGLDQNDGGGFDSPSEAYADITSIFEARESCVGRGLYTSQTCSGYGDPCLTCTGIRDHDYVKRQLGIPATPAQFVQSFCPIFGGSPCGGEPHCEAYVSAEAMWDLATRDLPLSGLDPATSWQIAERLWYLSRRGSGGDAYNCALPNSDGCGTNSWFHKLRLVDDEDGNLANGTPHAQAIFTAFNRHAIACGLPGDPSNQNTSSCPSLTAPALTVTPQIHAATLTWTPVTNANAYVIYRNELGCHRGQLIVDTVKGSVTTYTDKELADGVEVYYRVQALTSSPTSPVRNTCPGPVSNCVSAVPGP